MSRSEIFVTILFGLLVNEACDVSPWIANRMVRIAARMWTRDVELARIYDEEWRAYIFDRPGKLFKLATALGFLAAAVAKLGVRIFRKEEVPTVRRAFRFARLPRSGQVISTLGLLLTLGPLLLGAIFGPPWTTTAIVWIAVPVAGLMLLSVGVLMDTADRRWLSKDDPTEYFRSRFVAAQMGVDARLAALTAPDEYGTTMDRLFMGFAESGGMKTFEYGDPISARVRPYISQVHRPRSEEARESVLVRPYVG